MKTSEVAFRSEWRLNMLSIGIKEVILLIPVILITIGLPVAVLIVLVLMYRKVSRIEQILVDKDRDHKPN